MRLLRFALVAALFAVALPGLAKDKEAQFKNVEAKHFTKAEGVELSPEFTDYLYAELRAELTKAKIFGQVVGEGEVVDAPRWKDKVLAKEAAQQIVKELKNALKEKGAAK